MVRDCRHTTGNGQRLQTYYRIWSETVDIIKEMLETGNILHETARNHC
ncbi:unnamed protein product [Staurois parvus]|uniref:Uncharacterized protein n=1 Tax=Staurois parvus TaxID=386267 RepID=A0ABN9E9Y2_9NEOB|nr:unnamed protein product [Staurois parvus]